MSLYILGDVHGCMKTLMALVDKLPGEKNLAFVGDLIDRGPDSKEVVEYVMSNKFPCVLGNHEDLALYHHGRRPKREGIYDSAIWMRNGGKNTIKSYSGEISKEHLDYFETLPLTMEFPFTYTKDGLTLFLSHTTICDFGMKEVEDNLKLACQLDNPKYLGNSIIWNRGAHLNLEGVYHVYGHTPHNGKVVQEAEANVDTGGFYRKMTALRFPEMEIYEQEFIG